MKLKMPFRRRTRLDEKLASGIRGAMPEIQPPKALKPAVTAVVATTAASAAISAVRRRREGAGSHR